MIERVQLRRAKGWKMPPNTMKVDRTTPWGNPFVVGIDGTQAECVRLHRLLMGRLLCLSCKTELADQERALEYAEKHIGDLRGRSLACWCRVGTPCHADTLLEIANATPQAMRAPHG